MTVITPKPSDHARARQRLLGRGNGDNGFTFACRHFSAMFCQVEKIGAQVIALMPMQLGVDDKVPVNHTNPIVHEALTYCC
jgi:hypothetical protein